MTWLTTTIITMTPLSLAVVLLAAIAVGWTIYGLRGYGHWFRRFHRYRAVPSRRRLRRNYGYVEYIPEVVSPTLVRTPRYQTPVAPRYSTRDDLEVIEGIGPKVHEVLNENGIYTWRELAGTPTSNLSAMLQRSGIVTNPGTWSEQAKMAAAGQWDELKAYQDILVTGR